jgi:hypothetical protein
MDLSGWIVYGLALIKHVWRYPLMGPKFTIMGPAHDPFTLKKPAPETDLDMLPIAEDYPQGNFYIPVWVKQGDEWKQVLVAAHDMNPGNSQNARLNQLEAKITALENAVELLTPLSPLPGNPSIPGGPKK